MYVCVRVCKFIIGRLIQFGGEQTGEYSLCIATLRNTYYLSQWKLGKICVRKFARWHSSARGRSVKRVVVLEAKSKERGGDGKKKSERGRRKREISRASVRTAAWAHERRCCCWWFTLSANRPKKVVTFTLTFLCIVSLSIAVPRYFFSFFLASRERREKENEREKESEKQKEKRENDDFNDVLRFTGSASKRKTTVGREGGRRLREKKLNDLSLPSAHTDTLARAHICTQSCHKGRKKQQHRRPTHATRQTRIYCGL